MVRGVVVHEYLTKDHAKIREVVEAIGQKQFILFSTGIPSSLIYGHQVGIFRGSFDPGDRLLIEQNEHMSKEFGASGCTFYAFDTRESAKEADLFAYDALTFTGGRGPGRGLFSTQGMFQDSTNVFRDEKTTGGNSLKRLTVITGGKYYSNINMYEKNLDQVQALTGTYYVLGYSVRETWDGRFHEVKVEVKRKGCEVRAQTGYFSPKPYREYTPLESTKRKNITKLPPASSRSGPTRTSSWPTFSLTRATSMSSSRPTLPGRLRPRAFSTR